MDRLKFRHLVERAKAVVESRLFVETDSETKDVIVVSRTALLELYDDLYRVGAVHYGFRTPSRNFDGYVGHFPKHREKA